MPNVTNSITIQRSIEDVFADLTDVEHTGKWFPGNVESTGPRRHLTVSA